MKRYVRRSFVNKNETPHYQNGKGCLILGFASVIWGLAFVVQTDAATLTVIQRDLGPCPVEISTEPVIT